MKKRIMSTIMSIFMVPFVLSPYTIKSYADNEISNTSTIIEYFPDDSYIVITLIQDSNLVLSNTTSGSKTASYYNSDNELQWTYTVNGSYYYNQLTSSCTSVYDDYSIYINNWHIDSHSCWASGNSACGTVTMKKKIFGITVDTVTRDLTLSCSPTGTLY